MNAVREAEALASVSGKPAKGSYGMVVPSMFGRTTLFLFKDYIVEQTKRIVAHRDSEILLSEIDSGEIEVKGNPLWIVLGVLTIALFGLGIIFFFVYFLKKHKFLIIRSKSNAQLVCIKGDDSQFREFMKAVLQAAIAAKRQ